MGEEHTPDWVLRMHVGGQTGMLRELGEGQGGSWRAKTVSEGRGARGGGKDGAHAMLQHVAIMP